MVRRLTEGLNSKKEFEQFANYVYLECQKAGFTPHIFLDTRDEYDPDNHRKGEYNGYNASISLYTNESNYKKVLGKEFGIIYLWYGYGDTEYIDEPYIAIMFNYGSHRFGDDVDIDKTCESYSEAKMYVKELISTLKIQASQFLYNANECIKKYNKATAKSKSRTRKRSIKEGDASKKTNYAVQVRDMNSGYIHLFTGTKADCLKLEKTLEDFLRNMRDIIDSGDQDEFESNMDWLYEFVLSDYGHIEEIDYREIDDNNNYWDYDQPYHIINDYYFDMYL